MALRLIDTSAASAAASAVAPDAALIERARIAVHMGDLDAYRALVPDVLELEDPQRRYLARRTLVEIGLTGGPSSSTHAAASQTMLATAQVGLDLLAGDPSQPYILNLTGVALYELGALRGAEALFRAARALDPGLDNVARNLRSVKDRRRSGTTVKLPPQIAGAVPALDKRAKDLAGRCRLGGVESIALCMIVRDEEAVLARALASAKDAVDEIIVVDTGSADRTPEIARAFGAKVLGHAWQDDFAAARNVGLEAATSDWILFIDADEWLPEADAPQLRELTRRGWREGYRLQVRNRVGTEQDARVVINEALRLFRNRANLRFEGRVHENVMRRMPADAPELVESAPLVIEHDGYLQKTRVAKDKSRRNLELLERQLREDEPTPYLHYNLGSEYGAAGDLLRSIEHFARAWDLLLATDSADQQPYAPSLAARYASVLRRAGRLDDAIATAERGLQLFEGFTDLLYEQALAARAQDRTEDAVALLTRCLEQGDAPSRYMRLVGAGSFLAAIQLAEILLAAGDAETSAALALQTLTDHPHVLDVVEPLVRASIAGGVPADAVVALVAERVGELTTDVRFALAGALHGGGAAEAAERQLRALLDAEPEIDAARVALAEALLSQSRFAEAADIVEAVDADSMWGPLAAVSQAFGAIAAADADRTARALERAAATGVPSGERRLLGAWAHAAGLGGAPADQLPGDAAGLLMTSLEALLRVQEFDAFAALLPLAERIAGLDVRRRRELLGAMYLRRGFLDSAAEEWAAACQESGPDADALAGLAQVAAARGERDDARMFAEGALELDPAAGGAARVLAALAA